MKNPLIRVMSLIGERKVRHRWWIIARHLAQGLVKSRKAKAAGGG